MSEKTTNKDHISHLFTQAFTNISALLSQIESSFFTQALIRELSIMLGSFIDYRCERTVESRSVLENNLRNITQLIALISGPNGLMRLEIAVCEKSLLILQKAILDHKVPRKVKSTGKETKKRFRDKMSSVPSSDIPAVKKDIFDAIRTGGKVLNQDIFKRFSRISTRTIQRYLSDLIISGQVGRHSEGKKVYYVVTLK